MPNDTQANGPGAPPAWWAAILFGLAVALVVRHPLRPPARQHVATRSTAHGQPANGSGTVAGGDGRTAEASTQFTARSWKDILWRVVQEIGKHRILAVAASVTFYSLLALFPAVAALVSLYGLFADPGTIAKQLDALSSFMPGGALDVLGEQVKRIASKPHGSLSFGFVTGLLVALWSANAGVKAMFDALNIVYDQKEKRGFVLLNATSLLFTVGALLVALLALGAVVIVPIVLNLVGLGPLVEAVISIARWPLLLLVIVAALALLYRFGPSRKAPRWRWVTWGSSAAGTAWLIGSMLFSWYVSKFGSYNETFGSLGAAIGFMTWIWISSTIVLVGAEANAEMEHQTAWDTTEGCDKPLGTRDATMADTVA